MGLRYLLIVEVIVVLFVVLWLPFTINTLLFQVVSRGNDQVAITSKYESRADAGRFSIS